MATERGSENKLGTYKPKRYPEGFSLSSSVELKEIHILRDFETAILSSSYIIQAKSCKSIRHVVPLWGPSLIFSFPGPCLVG